MSVPPENIEVGKCYLATSTDHVRGGTARIRRVVRICPLGRVLYDTRRGPVGPNRPWPRQNAISLEAFARQADREVPCDWTPEMDAAAP